MPSATNAHTEAALQRRSRSVDAAPRAKAIQIASTTSAWRMDWVAASASAVDPHRLSEPWLGITITWLPNAWCAASRMDAPRVSICKGRLACPETLDQTPCGAKATKGTKTSAATARKTAAAVSAARRPSRRQT